MFRYEEYLAKKEGLNFRNEQWQKIWAESSSKSIEHIWPQSKAPDNVKHTLGNLMLLPPNLNSKLRDKPPKEKREAYRKTGLLIAEEVASVSKALVTKDRQGTGKRNFEMGSRRVGRLKISHMDFRTADIFFDSLASLDW